MILQELVVSSKTCQAWQHLKHLDETFPKEILLPIKTFSFFFSTFLSILSISKAMEENQWEIFFSLASVFVLFPADELFILIIIIIIIDHHIHTVISRKVIFHLRDKNTTISQVLELLVYRKVFNFPYVFVWERDTFSCEWRDKILPVYVKCTHMCVRIKFKLSL